MSVAQTLVDAWYQPRLTLLSALLLPLAAVYGSVVTLRRWMYRVGLFRVHRLPVPVVVVGNLTVGGAGKTPTVRALANALAIHGHRPGIVSRGYGGSAAAPRAVSRDDDPGLVGDEPLILATAGHPVFVGRDRVAAAHALLIAHPDCTVLLADDGLQHYALGRNVDVALIDSTRQLGNGFLLPAGPLREPAGRLQAMDAVVSLVPFDAPFPASRSGGRETAVTLVPLAFRNVKDYALTTGPERFRHGASSSPGEVHAVAGTANPQRFFASLKALGIAAIEHPFPDHHRFRAEDLDFPDAAAIVMTEKDAVKCREIADARSWYLPVEARLDPAFVTRVATLIGGR
jgi:tetraacyldisaccharide 4'-kinase